MKIIKNSDYEIIHFHTGHESALLCLLCYILGRKKIVIHAHTSKTGDENTTKIHMFKKKMVYAVSHIIYKKITKRVACSKVAAKFYFGTHEGNVRILNNGIDLERFRKVKKEDYEYGFCINARMDMQKNPFFVIDVIKELALIEPRIRLDWIGTGVLKDEIENKIKEYGLQELITLHGSCTDVERILGKSRYFLFPSLYEGLAIALIEAQAVGLKCFVSDAIPESANCGGCVFIPLQYDAVTWAHIIFEEMMKEKETIINNKKLSEFEINYTVKELEELYQNILLCNGVNE